MVRSWVLVATALVLLVAIAPPKRNHFDPDDILIIDWVVDDGSIANGDICAPCSAVNTCDASATNIECRFPIDMTLVEFTVTLHSEDAQTLTEGQFRFLNDGVVAGGWSICYGFLGSCVTLNCEEEYNITDDGTVAEHGESCQKKAGHSTRKTPVTISAGDPWAIQVNRGGGSLTAEHYGMRFKFVPTNPGDIR